MALRESYLHTSQYIGAGTHFVYVTPLVDKANVTIPVSALNTVTLTLIDLQQVPYSIVNGVNSTNIKNDGVRGVISAQGILTLTLIPADTVMLSTPPRFERRRARIEWSKIGSGDVEWKEIDVIIAPKTEATP